MPQNSKKQPPRPALNASPRIGPQTDPPTPSPNLPPDPATFWNGKTDLAELPPFPDSDATPVLKKLGPLPFPRGNFPIVGFLATLYDHVSAHAAHWLGHDDESKQEPK